jgi:hypothetical protein
MGCEFEKKAEHDKPYETTKTPTGTLYPILYNARWGYMDSTGKVFIKPVFKEAGELLGGVAIVRKDEDWGVIDESGKFIVEPLFDEIQPFTEGFALAMRDGKIGLIDKRGNFIVEPRYSYARSFSEGLALVREDDGVSSATYFIDTRGKVVITCRNFDVNDDFTEGIVRVSAGGRMGLMDKTGNIILKPQFDWIWSFNDGFAVVAEIDMELKASNPDGVQQYKGLEKKEAEARAWGKKGFISTGGKLIIPPICEDALSFNERFAPVKMNNQWGYVNIYGEVAIDPAFEQAYPFTDGMAWVKKGDKWALIDTSGRIRTDFVFENIGPYREGLAPVLIGEKWGYVDANGQVAIEARFDFAAEFNDGLAPVMFVRGGSKLLSDKEFQSFFAFPMDSSIDELHSIKGNFLEYIRSVNKESGNWAWGLCDKNGRVIIPAIFDAITEYQGGLFQVKLNTQIGYMNKQGNYVWKLKS